MPSEVPRIRAEVLAAEDHNDVVVMVVATIAAEVKMAEASPDLLGFHDQLKMHFDVLNGLVLPLVVLLNHSFSGCCYSMEDLTVFDCALRMKAVPTEGGK